ncbi:DUF4145 domain-containing protein [Burkholderia cenocepacia]|uniref:DUF4145 domain-containing protein n=1 Tax=Burkholderia cenocepacia TaxID=95486 RepID=UPI00285901D6|nr:DUF4145 domain-containing protein [Burkholderia cenocepacia]MDR8077622.1 DUF4145 domain-containing protein [Burkholderia cenocepacia]
MDLNQKFAQRFLDLADMYKAMPFKQSEYSGRYVENGFWRKWATNAENLIKAVFGGHSPHYQNFARLHANANEMEDTIGGLHAVFLAAKEDFEGGYVFDVEMRVSGEVFGDFVKLAREALGEGHHHVAAVLASAALEDALKRYATANGLDVEGKDMQNTVNALKGAGLVSGAQKSLLDAMPKLRNAALHAEWERLNESEVGSILGYVEQFLLTKFSD